jgi:hypothetical protein
MTPTVYPSGLALATESIPIAPVPPTRFTTLMLTPKCFLPFFTSVRASVSVPPPADHGTTRVMSLSGKLPAGTEAGSARASARTPINRKPQIRNMTASFR